MLIYVCTMQLSRKFIALFYSTFVELLSTMYCTVVSKTHYTLHIKQPFILNIGVHIKHTPSY